MPILPRGHSPTPGSLSSAIRAAVYLRKTAATIFKKLKKLIGRVSKVTVQKLIDYWRATKNDASAFQRSGGGIISGKIATAARTASSRIVRVGWRIEFFDPNIDDTRYWGSYIDVDARFDKSQILQAILNEFVGILIKFYEYKRFNNQDLVDIYSNIEVQSIEKV